jgi:beta-galactosidase
MSNLDRRSFLKGSLSSAAYAVFGPEAKAAIPAAQAYAVVWDTAKAYREATATRERISVNGLWRWQPSEATSEVAPTEDWGYLRVPEIWPGGRPGWTDPQFFFPNSGWGRTDFSDVTAAWYLREITVPLQWSGRRITLSAEYLNSYAVVYLDGAKQGEMRFPGGEVDLTTGCRPGQKQVLSIRVMAMPLSALMQSFENSVAPPKAETQVKRRGLLGDVSLDSTPKGARITDVKVETSVRQWQITFDTQLAALESEASYALRARISDEERQVIEFTSPPFRLDELATGRIRVTENWRPEKLWDTCTPENQYEVSLTLLDSTGKVLDTALPVRFGFREFWIDGRDFCLNGTRIYLAAVPLDNALGSAAMASYQATRATLQWFKSFGINFVYTHNYSCLPGTHRTYEEVLRAADDEGVLVSFTQPHFGDYDWSATDAATANGYAHDADFYVRVAQNHPAIVCYSTSHNALGYADDMNPDMIDGLVEPRPRWALRGAGHALQAEMIIRRLDPSRFVYHHESGNMGAMYTVNFYGNWIPIQEMSDWFEHWATFGVKPLFTCEYSVPMMWDWSMYRGWYKGKREWGSAVVPWEFCLAEWDAQSLGSRSYQITGPERENLRWEAKQFRLGRVWHRWDYPYPVGSQVFADRLRVFATYLTENFRAFRTWGVSATNSWDYPSFWEYPQGKKYDQVSNLKLDVDWEQLQRPGPLPAYVQMEEARHLLAFHSSDYKPTAAAEALIANDLPLLAYIGGKEKVFTSKDHNFLPGETVEKQLIVINNSRTEVTADCEWSLDIPQIIRGAKKFALLPGEQKRVPLMLDLPGSLAPGQYALNATFKFSNGKIQEDTFTIDALPRPMALQTGGEVALFDPKGETAKLLDGMGVRWERVDASADVSGYDTLVIGKGALTLHGAAPDLRAVRDGLKVLIFEQTGEVLEKRFGFRIAEYGLRWVFKRVPDHPILAGLEEENLCNWRGEATALPPRLNYDYSPRYEYSPTVKWAGIPVTRVWRCGNRGNVASALIEKPACGDFLPILDGGYALQYSPLLEHRAGKGVVLFCQMDVNGRTETDPAAELLARNILEYIAAWKPSLRRAVVYAGEPPGADHLASAGFQPGLYSGVKPSPEQVLVVGPGGGKQLAAHAQDLAQWVEAGGRVLAVGLDEENANAFLPTKVSMAKQEHIAAYFAPFCGSSPLAGVSPAEVHNRDPRDLDLITAGAKVVGNGVLAILETTNVVFCQLVPWQFDDYAGGTMNIKRTYRRVSCLLARLLANLQAASETRMLEHIATPVAGNEMRWLDGLYLDTPEEWDDPYRYFRW